MELFHTSAEEIISVTNEGLFEEFLFFSPNVYAMTAGDYITYAIELDNSEVIDAGRLFYHDDAEKLDSLVADFCHRFDVDTDSAEEIISERDQLESDDCEDLWEVQLFTARAAKILGYRAVRVQDEQGSAYMIDMLGHESELTRV
jgi:hypothetical protein